jgi:hypothetical protein
MKTLITIMIWGLTLSCAIAQNADADMASDSTDQMMQQKIEQQRMQQEVGMVAAQQEQDQRAVLGLYNIKGPQLLMGGEATQSDSAQFRGALETYFYASRELRIAEINPQRLGAVYQEFTNQEIGLTKFVNDQKQRGEWIGVDYFLTQESAKPILDEMNYYQYLPGWLRNLASENSPKQVVNIALYDANSGEKFNVFAAKKGNREDPKTYATQVTQNIESLVRIQNIEQRKLYTQIQQREAFNRSFTDPSLMTMAKVFGIMFTGIAAHAIIQGKMGTKILAGGIYGAGGYLMWSSVKGLQKVRDVSYEETEQLIDQYEAKYGRYE